MNIIPYLGRGIGHERAGVPCQDAVCWRVCADGKAVMALSDGAGSAEFAKEAAELTAQSVVDFFVSAPLSDFLTREEAGQKADILRAVREALERHPSYQPENAGQFSATLLFTVAEGESVLFGHLGDGAAYAENDAGELVYESEPEKRGEGGTYFGVSPEAPRHLRLTVRDAGEIAGAVLLSDGPYTMFRNRGGGAARETARELMDYARENQLTRRSHLRDALSQMAEYPGERLDDWSVLLLTRNQDAGADASELETVSMLDEETEKYQPGGDDHV
ncbi:MAG: protein phosphatase 2C domain-containing protein [Oscillospiraceae bacterium]|nr:protein phosphatase 2C domain-containing protein [Oscillospiraceae bacterium]